MAYFTFLSWLEVTVEAPDAGEAADIVGTSLKALRRLETGSPGDVLAVVDADVWPRWWRARPVEIVELERARRARKKQSK